METKRQVVNVTTQDEWDIVNKELNNGFTFSYSEYFPCIDLSIRKHGSVEHYENNNYQILTFDEWCKSRGIFVTYDGVVKKQGELVWYCYRSGFQSKDELDKPTESVDNIDDNNIFYFFSTPEACQQYLDNIHNKPKVDEVKQDETYFVAFKCDFLSYEQAVELARQRDIACGSEIYIYKAIAKATKEFKITEL